MVTGESEIELNLKQLAEQAVLIAHDDYGVDLDYTMESLPTLYKLLERAHILKSSPAYEGIVPNRTIQIWGAYLGEIVRRSRGGSWKENPAANGIRRYSVYTPTGNIYPMEQIYLRVVPGIQTSNLRAAVKEPPTMKATADHQLVLLVATVGLLTIVAGTLWLFIQ
ncbi:MAG: hypothetical protein GX577_10475 [Leptolinea sp.]|nr:hypothetical protein [Leptolinea sp.]